MEEVQPRLVSLEKSLSINRDHRLRFPDQPERFMASESALHESVRELLVVAASESAVAAFADHGGLEVLVEVLAHENADVVAAAVEVMEEIVDPEMLARKEQLRNAVVTVFLDQQGLEVLVESAERLDRDNVDEMSALDKILSLLENLLDVQPSIADACASRTNILQILLSNIESIAGEARKSKADAMGFDQIVLYCSEILSIILQSGNGATRAIFSGKPLGGLERLLNVLTFYKNDPPKDSSEIEFAENLLNTLSLVLFERNSKIVFGNAGGFELCLQFVKNRDFGFSGSLRLLDLALQSCPINCMTFIDTRGLKTLFATFMNKRKIPKRLGITEESTLESTMSCLVSLFYYTSDVHYLRLMNKFNEMNFEKVHRLKDVLLLFLDRVNSIHDDELGEEELYLMRLDAGLLGLHFASIVFGFLLTSDDDAIVLEAHRTLRDAGISKKAILDLIIEHRESIGDSDELESSSQSEFTIFQRQVLDGILILLDKQ